jgi:hypothetical protein
MLQFIENTWFLWWILALIAIFRWLHVLFAGSELGDLDETAETGPQSTPASGSQLPLGA